MKKSFFLLFAFALCIYVNSQQVNSSFTKEDYLQKSKKQKRTALVLLGGGFLSSTTGFLTIGGKQTSSVDNGIMMIGGVFHLGHYRERYRWARTGWSAPGAAWRWRTTTP